MKNERIDRKQFLGLLVLGVAIQILAIFIPFMLGLNVIVITFAIAASIFAYYVKVVGVIKRFHDISDRLSKSIWWLTVIPGFGLIAIIFLIVKKGETSDNKYGAEPSSASLKTMLFSGLSVGRVTPLPSILNALVVTVLFARVFILINYVLILTTQHNILGSVMSDSMWGYSVVQLMLMIPAL